MINRQQGQGNYFQEMDDHEAPTEPMMPVFLYPSVTEPDTDGSIPAPHADERPFPMHVPMQVPSGQVPVPPVYPVLPAAPISDNGRPGGGAASAYPVPEPKAQKVRSLPGRSRVPALVGLVFVLVQMLLLVRFVLKLLNMAGTTSWIGLTYDISSLFVLPFYALLQNVQLPVAISMQVATLLAILIYGLISRLLVRFLKALLHSR